MPPPSRTLWPPAGRHYVAHRFFERSGHAAGRNARTAAGGEPVLGATRGDIRPLNGNRGAVETNTPNHRRSATVGVRWNDITPLRLAEAAPIAVPPGRHACAATQQSGVDPASWSPRQTIAQIQLREM